MMRRSTLSCALRTGIVRFAQLSWGVADIRALLQKADQLEDSDRLSEALEVLKSAEQSDPENPEVLYRISNCNAESVDFASDEKEKKAYAQTALKYANKRSNGTPVRRRLIYRLPLRPEKSPTLSIIGPKWNIPG